MTIYFLFGKTGTGKSYVGDILANRTGLPHIDGDKFITSKMREALATETPIKREMIDEFVLVLVDKIKGLLGDDPDTSFIVSQAMYMNEHRQILLSAFGDHIKLILIDSDDAIRQERIKTRFEAEESKVTLEVAAEMDAKYEKPSHIHDTLSNDNDNEAIYQAFQALRDPLKLGLTDGGSECDHLFSPS